MTDTDGGKRKLVDNLEEEGDGTKMQRVGEAEDEELVYDDDDDAAAEEENPKRKAAAQAKAIAGVVDEGKPNDNVGADLCVRSLAWSTTADELRTHFEKFGKAGGSLRTRTRPTLNRHTCPLLRST